MLRALTLLTIAAIALGLGAQALITRKINSLARNHLEEWARSEGVVLQVDALQLYPWSARIAVQSLMLSREAQDSDQAFVLELPEASIGVDWSAMLQRRLSLTSLSLVDPKLTVTARRAKAESQPAKPVNPGTNSEPPPNASEPAPPGRSAAGSNFTTSAIADGRTETLDLPNELAVRVAGGQIRLQTESAVIELTGISAQSLPSSASQRWLVQTSALGKVRSLKVGPDGTSPELAELRLKAEISRAQQQRQVLWVFELVEGSQLAAGLSLGQLSPKGSASLKSRGIDLADQVLGGELKSPCRLQGRLEQGMLKLSQTATLSLPSFELNLLEGSWLRTDATDSGLSWQCVATPGTQAQIERQLATRREDLELGRAALKALANDKGMLTLDFETSGPLGKSNTEPKLERALKNLLRGEGLGDLLKGLMKKLR